jgi:hypothetical protein
MTDITRNDAVSVDSSVTLVSSSKPASERVDLILRNMDSTKTIFVAISDAESAALNKGIPLRPYDGIAFTKDQTRVPQGAVTAIASAAGGATLTVFERYQ